MHFKTALIFEQYFESTAARELFEFKSMESVVYKVDVAALQNVLDHGVSFFLKLPRANGFR